MGTRLLRYLLCVSLVLWLGAITTTTFFVAPSLFGNESGETPNSTIAANVIAPLLHKMELTGWILIPVMLILLGVLWTRSKRASPKVFVSTGVMLALAWGLGLYSGIPVTNEMHEIRIELKERYGGYHLAPDNHPDRARFRGLHAAASSITMVNLLLGLGALFCVTQLIGREESSGSNPG